MAGVNTLVMLIAREKAKQHFLARAHVNWPDFALAIDLSSLARKSISDTLTILRWRQILNHKERRIQ